MKVAFLGFEFAAKRSVKFLEFTAILKLANGDTHEHELFALTHQEALRASADIARDLCLTNQCTVRGDVVFWAPEGLEDKCLSFVVVFDPQAVVTFL